VKNKQSSTSEQASGSVCETGMQTKQELRFLLHNSACVHFCFQLFGVSMECQGIEDQNMEVINNVASVIIFRFS